MHRTLISALLATTAVAAPASRFTYYPLKTLLAAPCDMDTGADGHIYADTFLSNKVVEVNPKTGKLTEYDIPYTTAPLPLPNNAALSQAQGAVGACVVRAGKDGKLYLATGVRNQFARIDPFTKKVEVFNTGDPQDLSGNLQPFNDGWPGETGMWFTMTTGNKLCLFDYKTTKSTCYPIPTPGAGPLGVQVASDKAVWITEMLSSKIGRFDPHTKTWTEYQLAIPLGSLPTVIRVEDAGKIWFTSLGGNSQVSIDIKTKALAYYPDPKTSPLALPNENTLDRQGRIWFSTITDNTLNYFTIKTKQFGAVVQPDNLLNVAGVSALPNGNIGMHYDSGSNSIWFAGLTTNYIGRYQL